MTSTLADIQRVPGSVLVRRRGGNHWRAARMLAAALDGDIRGTKPRPSQQTPLAPRNPDKARVERATALVRS